MLKAQSAECKTTTPLNEHELIAYERRLYDETGKGLVHPDEFAEIYVRNEVKKHFDRKYSKSNNKQKGVK
jgi:hypothetical protein